MSYYEPEEDPFADPYGGGMDDQAMIDFLIANGVGTGLLPQVQPSGKQMTTSNITSALSANRQGLFDTAFMGGMGGADAFAPGAFQPTVSTTIRQEPELQQVYSYLRSPTSMEGIITQELMAGGTPATAQRNLRQLLTASDEEVAAIFAEYDALFNREPTVTVADVPRIKENLLLELPPARDEFGNPMPVEADGTGVDWNNSEDMSVFARANTINELNAQIPRIGPSAPKWGTDPTTGQPVQISAGGELQWGTDETGSPVMIEVTETPSQAKSVFDKLGLPDPSQEYTAEDFMTPDQIAMQQAYAQTEDPVAQLKAAWMDPSLAPGNEYTPQRPQGAIPNLTEEQLAGQPVSAANEPRYNFPTGLNEPGGAVVNAPGPGDVQTTAAQLLPHDPGAISQFMQQVYPTLDRATQDALAGYLTDTGQADLVPAQPQTVMEQGGQALAAPDILPQDPGAVDEWMRTVYPTLARGDQDAVDAYLATQQGSGSGWAGEGVNVDELMRRRAEGYPAVPPPPGPPSDNPVAEALDMFIRGGQPAPPDYPAGDPATYEQFLAENPPLGPPRTPAYARPGAQPANQPGGAGFQPGATQATVDALLAQLLPGNQQRSTNLPAYARSGAQPANQPGGPGFQAGPPDWPQQRLPSGQVQQTGPTGREDWMRAQTLTGAGGGQGSNAMPGTPYWGAGGVGNQAMSDAMLAQLLPGNQQRSTSLPPSAQRGAQPANQPGGPQYMEAIETGERRAAQRQQDEQSASVLGGSTDRTGRRVRPTRTGEQARQYRAAFEAWDQATDEQQRMKQQAYSFEAGRAGAQAWLRRAQGVRPLDQAMMARRLVMMNAGVPQGI